MLFRSKLIFALALVATFPVMGIEQEVEMVQEEAQALEVAQDEAHAEPKQESQFGLTYEQGGWMHRRAFVTIEEFDFDGRLLATSEIKVKAVVTIARLERPFEQDGDEYILLPLEVDGDIKIEQIKFARYVAGESQPHFSFDSTSCFRADQELWWKQRGLRSFLGRPHTFNIDQDGISYHDHGSYAQLDLPLGFEEILAVALRACIRPQEYAMHGVNLAGGSDVTILQEKLAILPNDVAVPIVVAKDTVDLRSKSVSLVGRAVIDDRQEEISTTMRFVEGTGCVGEIEEVYLSMGGAGCAGVFSVAGPVRIAYQIISQPMEKDPFAPRATPAQLR